MKTTATVSSPASYSITEHFHHVEVVRHARGCLDITIAEFRAGLGFPFLDAVEAAERLIAALIKRGEYASGA